MECEILASVMNQGNKNSIIKRLGISEDDKCVIVNQVAKNKTPGMNTTKGNHRFLSFKERGLSRSRNRALENAVGDICLIADDDMEYEKDYSRKIIHAYRKYRDADIIAFIVDKKNKNYTPKIKNEGRLNALMTMRLSSVQITFKRQNIVKKGIRFDEEFGAGSKYQWGEENIFLFDCIRKGCRIYYVPVKIATLLDIDKTSWDKSNTTEHFEQQGAIFYRMSPKFWRILALQFVLRKRKIYISDMSGMEVYRSMVRGAKAYGKEHRCA